MAEQNRPKTVTCPVCEQAVPDQAELCPECGWELEASEGELIIGDPEELQQEARRKQQKLLLYRKFYHTAQQNRELEAQLFRLEEALEQKAAEFRNLKQRQRRYGIITTVFVLFLIGMMIFLGMQASKTVAEIRALEARIAELQALQNRVDELNKVSNLQEQQIQALQTKLENLADFVKKKSCGSNEGNRPSLLINLENKYDTTKTSSTVSN